ncbi:unnamed protein product [Prorocentrum cordatum]|uniref:Uncharacterized protein n=1 Tax=Prorocentrum cordatum TaxID=2364126 RepID=A0ABN9VCG3_9DINO|nr:unnamed protein product [Polarella glacialis]
MVQDMKKMKAGFGYKSQQDMNDRLLKLEVATTDINAQSDMCDSDPEDELQKGVNDKKGEKTQMVQDVKKMKAAFGYKSEQDMDDRLLKLEVATTDINAQSDMCDSDPEDELQKGVNDKKGEKTQMVQDVKKMKAAFGYKSEQDMDDRLLKLEVKNVVVTNIVSEGPAGSSEGTADHSTDERCSLDGDPHAGVNAIDRTPLAGTVCSTQCTATPSDTASQSRLLEYLTNHEAALLSGCSEGHAAGVPPPCLDTNALGMWNTMGVLDEASLDEAANVSVRNSKQNPMQGIQQPDNFVQQSVEPTAYEECSDVSLSNRATASADQHNAIPYFMEPTAHEDSSDAPKDESQVSEIVQVAVQATAVPPWECDDPEDDEDMRAHKRRFRARLKRS